MSLSPESLNNITESFLEDYAIDLVVHRFADAADAELQAKTFFAVPIQLGKFQRINYYQGFEYIQRIQGCMGDGDSSEDENDAVPATTGLYRVRDGVRSLVRYWSNAAALLECSQRSHRF